MASPLLSLVAAISALWLTAVAAAEPGATATTPAADATADDPEPATASPTTPEPTVGASATADTADAKSSLPAAVVFQAEPTAAPPTMRSTPPSLSAPGPVPFPAPSGLTVRLSGFVHADAVAYDQASQDEVDPSTGAPLNQTRALIRRARLRLDVDHGPMGGSLELDGNTTNGASVGLINAEVLVRVLPRHVDDRHRPWFDAALGLLRPPWGYEVGQRDQERFFLERSQLSRALLPGVFDLGLRVRGGWRFLDVQLALLNGDPVGERAFPVQDPNRAKDIVGRLGVSGGLGRVTFSLGAFGLRGTGFHRGTLETKDVITWRDQNEDGLVQLSEIQVIAGSAATPSRNFRRFALGADARATVALFARGALDVFVEATWAANLDRGLLRADPVSTGRDLRERGWIAGFVQQLGARCTIGGRYDSYDPDADAAELRAIAVVPVDARFTAWTATAAWRWTDLDRVTMEYQHVTNPLGRTAAGAPTTLGADTVTIRGQVAW